jgi:energy-coupling factor transporter transmembrane protein EcfT
MEARNFVPGKNRTRLHTLTWGYMDTMLLTLGFATIVLVIWMR